MAGKSKGKAANRKKAEKVKLSNDRPPEGMSPELYARLKGEVETPYKGLRKFIYGACAASGLVGGLIFLTQLLAGKDVEAALPNLAVQIGVVALMVGLFRWESRNERK